MMKCGTCIHYGDAGNGDPGYCLWASSLPPMLIELLAALEADTRTSIAYSVFNGMEVSVDEHHCCSGWAQTRESKSDGL